jgi:hypothetical protein
MNPNMAICGSKEFCQIDFNGLELNTSLPEARRSKEGMRLKKRQ